MQVYFCPHQQIPKPVCVVFFCFVLFLIGICPKPLKNRDVVMLRSWRVTDDDEYIIVNYSVKHPVSWSHPVHWRTATSLSQTTCHSMVHVTEPVIIMLCSACPDLRTVFYIVYKVAYNWSVFIFMLHAWNMWHI